MTGFSGNSFRPGEEGKGEGDVGGNDPLVL